jgi:hypothetical protein
MQPSGLPYLLVGCAAIAQRRARTMVAAGVQVTAMVARPALRVWSSGPAAPVRGRAAGTADPLIRDGRQRVQRARRDTRRAADDALRRVADAALQSGITDAAVDRSLSSGAVHRMVAVVINHPATEGLVAGALDDPALDRLAGRLIDSRLVDELTARLLESDELRLVLTHVTQSPELRAALAEQTMGFADDVTIGVRARTVSADDTVERLARSLIRRPRRAQPG